MNTVKHGIDRSSIHFLNVNGKGVAAHHGIGPDGLYHFIKRRDTVGEVARPPGVALQLIARMTLFVAVTALNLESRRPVVLKFAAILRGSCRVPGCCLAGKWLAVPTSF